MLLEELTQQYLSLKTQEEEIKIKKEKISAQIKELLRKLPETRFQGNSCAASLVESYRFTYTDKPAVMTYLKRNGYNNYIKETIDEPALNKLIKESNSVATALKNTYTKSVVESLRTDWLKGDK